MQVYICTGPDKEFDLYIAFNARELDAPMRWHTSLHQMGYSLCFERYVTKDPAKLRPLLEKTRCAALVLTSDLFDSWFCCHELGDKD